jgi:hypothetical protein
MSRRQALARRSGEGVDDMLKWLIRNRLSAFEKKYGYDMSYARDVLGADTGAFMAFSKVMKMSGYRKDIPVEPYWAAKIVGAMSEDCGPCTQLVVTMALEAGVDAKRLAAVVGGDDRALPEGTLLAVQFARAALAHAPEADDLRDEVAKSWGPRGLVTLCFAITSARIFPTLKYALGHGKACMRVRVGDADIVPRHAHSAA